MKAKEYLKQIQKYDRMILNKMQEKEQWLAVATGMTGSVDCERVKASFNQKKMENAVINSTYLDDEIENMTRKKKEIISLIEKLPVLEYDVLFKIYVLHRTFFETAAELDTSYSNVTTIHGRGLKHIDDMLKKDDKKPYAEIQTGRNL